MKKIICYGDSNTYGYDADTYGRFPKEIRWTGILAAHLDYAIINMGENGREIPFDEWDLAEIEKALTDEAPFDLVTIMLGTNDLLFMYRSGMPKIAARMQNLLTRLLSTPPLSAYPEKLLLIAPTPTNLAHLGEDGRRLDRISLDFHQAYADLACANGIRFADAGEWQLPLAGDGVHLTKEAHRIFAERMERILASL